MTGSAFRNDDTPGLQSDCRLEHKFKEASEILVEVRDTTYKGGADYHYRLRIGDQKRKTVAALRNLNYHVIAAGDSYNDTAMLKEANIGFLFRAPENVKQEFPQFQAVETYPELLKLAQEAL